MVASGFLAGWEAADRLMGSPRMVGVGIEG